MEVYVLIFRESYLNINGEYVEHESIIGTCTKDQLIPLSNKAWDVSKNEVERNSFKYENYHAMIRTEETELNKL